MNYLPTDKKTITKRNKKMKILTLKTRFSLSFRFAAAVAALFVTATASALPEDFYADESRLASGKWVKVGVPVSGVYSVSYDELRAMGFENPEQVGVFGRGGAMLENHFTDAEGNPLLVDDVQPVGALHHGDMLIFYGRGTDRIEWDGNSGKHKFANKGRNIYTDTGSYFLTDKYGNMEIAKAEDVDVDDNASISEVFSYFYHEKDLTHNYLNSGRLFLGEKLTAEPLELNYQLSGADLNRDIYMSFDLYGRVNSTRAIKYGFNGVNSGTTRIPAFTTDTALQSALSNSFSGKTAKSEGTLSFTGSITDDDIVNLDYVLISFCRSGALQDGESQYIAALPALSVGVLDVKNPLACVWDVSNPYAPVFIPGIKGEFGIAANDEAMTLAVFDIDAELCSISGFEPVENSNLHSIGLTEVPEMLIITLPEFKDAAEKIALIHSRTDGVQATVVIAEDVYNEFSGGNPDPMAYRSICKMLYERDKERFANVFLIGPILADARQLSAVDGNKINSLIAFQSKESKESLSSFDLIDVTGMLGDYSEEGFQNRIMDIGIGVLPVSTPEQVEMYARKVEHYLTDPSFAEWNTFIHYSADFGNSHLHLLTDEQLAEDINDTWNNKMLFRKDYLNCKPLAEPTRSFLREARNGLLLSTYFGHGCKTYVGSGELGFLYSGTARTMDNDRLLFMTFAGCMVSRFDIGQYGVGDAITIFNPKGAIGSLATLRTTWANQNTSLIRQFQSALYEADENGLAPTLGKAVAQAKTNCPFANKFNFQLVCDPSIRIPVPALDINAALPEMITPASGMKFNGSVVLKNGAVDKNFNGNAVIRILQPFVTVPSANTQEPWKSEHIDVEYPGEIIATFNVEVKDGRFSAEDLFVPAALAQYKGEKGVINISAYDPARRISAASTTQIEIGATGSESFPSSEPPVITDLRAETRGGSVMLRMSATSGNGLRINSVNFDDPLRVEIDGDAYSPSLLPFATLGDGARNLQLDLPLALPAGRHLICVSVTDYAGLTTHGTVEFDSQVQIVGDMVEPDEKVASEKVTFTLPSDQRFDTRRELVVYSYKNEIVKIVPAGGSTAEWNLTDMSGAPVADGLYKVVLRALNPLGEPMQTSPCRMPVVR